ncbi:long-chain-fatty-acid--CoA ligase [Aestuariivirga litoralis]|uniref:long-chain-fatty-acid--CoA ligase n=1 Tax=Aestuariivirga litoralis TaxID=2650924 RepID=UPI0018C743C2|nr:long-chain fatty acid--CoA ligase [Aestuariivirga litoralis]MBG1232590.1 long-chain fatty acid--CoA ligase [Aestuariivirga litoralis]
MAKAAVKKSAKPAAKNAAPKLQHIPVKPVYAILDEAVAAAGSRRAIDFLDRHWTYAELGALVDKAAAGFRSIGVGPGVKVGLHLPNCPYYIVCYFAILKAGGIIVNYNPLYVERELAHQIKDSETSIMVTMDLVQLHSKVASLIGKTPLKKLVVCKMHEILPSAKGMLFKLLKRKEQIKFVEDDRQISFDKLISSGKTEAPKPINPETEIAVLQYTGGTTGVPKGAVLTHANVSANVEQLVQWMGQLDEREDKMLCVLPFFHVFGMTVAMLVGIANHAELILLPRFEIKQVLNMMEKKKPTMFPGVPTLYIAINRAVAERGGKLDCHSIRKCVSGGAALPHEVRSEFERITGCQLVEGFGLSESSPVATCNPFFQPFPDGSIGLPLPGTAIEIRSLENPRKLMPPGEKGEVCVRGPQVMQGYWNKPEETKAVMIDGALRTGDVGFLDENGFGYIVDRIKDLIICSGYNVYPRVIEDALYAHPCVAEAVVVGIADAYRGQAPKAFVKLKDGTSCTSDELKTHLAEHLSKLEMPHVIEFRTELPKTAVGKLSKKALLEEEKAKAAA